MDSLDNLFDVLRNERRRYVLYYLAAQDRAVPIEELVEQVARWGAEEESPPLPDEVYERAQITLTHRDLPKLSDEPYVQYNRDARRIELTQPPPTFNAIVSIAEIIDNPDIDATDTDED